MVDFFNSYIISILSMGITVFICEWICSNSGSGKNIANAISFVAGLCLFITVIFPFFSQFSTLLTEFTQSLNTFENDESTSEYDELYRLTAIEVSEKVSSLIYEEYGIKPIRVSIQLSEHENTMGIDKADVILSEKDMGYKEQISSFLSDNGFENNSIKAEDEKFEDT